MFGNEHKPLQGGALDCIWEYGISDGKGQHFGHYSLLNYFISLDFTILHFTLTCFFTFRV